MNNGADHTLCAFSLWKVQVRCEQLELENSALRAELDKVKPQPKEDENADVTVATD